MTVIEDKRIQVAHIEFKNQWDLMIKDVKPEDDGVYECQISTTDRTVRRIITLNVVGRKTQFLVDVNINVRVSSETCKNDCFLCMPSTIVSIEIFLKN